MFNQVALTGKVFESEMRYTSNGKAVAQTNLSFKTGKGKEYSSIQVVFWDKNAERITQLANDAGKKGVDIVVKGFLKQDKWESKEGQKRSRINIVANSFIVVDGDKTFLSVSNNDRNDNDNNKSTRKRTVSKKKTKVQETEDEVEELSDDDTLPF